MLNISAEPFEAEIFDDHVIFCWWCDCPDGAQLGAKVKIMYEDIECVALNPELYVSILLRNTARSLSNEVNLPKELADEFIQKFEFTHRQTLCDRIRTLF